MSTASRARKHCRNRKHQGKQFYSYYLWIVNSTSQKHHCKPDKQRPLWSSAPRPYLINIKPSPELNFWKHLFPSPWQTHSKCLEFLGQPRPPCSIYLSCNGSRNKYSVNLSCCASSKIKCLFIPSLNVIIKPAIQCQTPRDSAQSCGSSLKDFAPWHRGRASSPEKAL